MNAPPETWPAERFYWALIDAAQWQRAGPLPPGLRDVAEEVLPVPSADLHLVGAPLDGRLLVCGAATGDLEALGPGVHALIPREVPECLGVRADPATLNLLTGAFEPRPIRRARTRRHAIAMASLLAAAALIATGLHRRAAAWEGAATRHSAETASLLDRHSPGRTAEQLALEVLRQRAAATQAELLAAPPEAAPALVQVLQSWPAQRPARPLSLNITARTASISVVLAGDAAPFIGAFTCPPGWSLEEPRLNSAGATTRVSLELRRGGEVGP